MSDSDFKGQGSDKENWGAKARAVLWPVLLALVLLAGLGAWWAMTRAPAPLAPVSKVTIALPAQINSAPVFVAERQGLFKQAGVDVAVQSHKIGKDALKALLEGQADLAVVTDTPFIFARQSGQDIAILAGISQARRTLAIAGRVDRGIHSVKDLVGKRIGLQMGTNFSYFLEAVLQVNGIDSSQVILQDMKVDAAIAAVKDGSVDAAVVYQPRLTEMKEQMGEALRLFFGEDVYAFRYLLVGKSSYIDTHPQECERVLRGLLAAKGSIQKNPAEARQLMGEIMKFDEGLMSKVFDPTDYVLTLDQAMLLALDDETRWAMRRGFIKPGPMPNNLDAIRFKPLEAVDPSAVKIVH